MGEGYRLRRGRLNRADRVPARTRLAPRGGWRCLPPLCLLLVAVLFAGGCRLPAREWRWRVSGGQPTWLETLGEQRGCGLSVRAWVADRVMWPFPWPGSRRLFYGDDDLVVLIIIENRGAEDVRFDGARPKLVAAAGGEERPPGRRGPGCLAAVPPGGRGACTLEMAAPRGEEKLTLDLSDALPCAGTGFAFRLERDTLWRWRSVGPGVPGL